MLEHATGTVSFFQAMAPLLIANVLTVTFVYCFPKIHPEADNSSSVLGRDNSTKKRLTISSTAKLPQRFRIS
jgi:hypothetical protein